MPQHPANKPIRLAIIGCGAIAREMHIPTALALATVELRGLVDSDLGQAENAAREFQIPVAAAALEDVADQVDAVLLATPPHVRPALAAQAFRHGLDVFAEKPLANTVRECEAITAAAAEAGRLLAVGHMFRFYPVRERLLALVREHELGQLLSVTATEGKPYSWSTISGYTVRQEMSPGGVLINAGIHTLDSLLAWFGDPLQVQYEDDSVGGLESNVRLRMLFADGLTADFRQSRTCPLPYTITIRAERGTLTLGTSSVTRYAVTREGQTREYDCADPGITHRDCWKAQFQDFLTSVQTRTRPRVDGVEGTRVIRLVESCYSQRRRGIPISRCPLPGLTGSPPAAADGQPPAGPWCGKYGGKKVLVLGGTGFVGGRLAERLVLEESATVRVLVRNWAKAVWIARYPAQLVFGDLGDREALSAAMNGVDVVFHCASGLDAEGSYRQTNVQGTQNVLECARQCGVGRVVYVSSTAVHGPVWPETLDESAPTPRTGRDYSDSKIDAEAVVLGLGRQFGLPVSIVRPTYVWGPRSQLFTIAPLRAMKNGTFGLVDHGQGACHAVYVDNLVDALLLAGYRDEAVGEAFIVTDGESERTWQSFFQPYADLLGLASLGSVSSKSPVTRILVPLHGFLNRALEYLRPNPAPLWRKVIRRVCFLGRNQLARRGYPASQCDIQKYSHRSHVDLSKASRLLGYHPSVSSAVAQEETVRWVQDQLAHEFGFVTSNECPQS